MPTAGHSEAGHAERPLNASALLATDEPALVADVGGTHARFALVSGGSMAPQLLAKVACADYPGLDAAIADQLDRLPCTLRPRRAAIAVAAVVSGDVVRLTNLEWEFPVEELRQGLDLDELLLLNDFEALAWSLPQLRDDELRRVGSGRADPRGPRAVIGPGTGLGVSGLIPCRGGWAAIRGEGGHVSFSPADERELALLACVWRDFPHVSAERLVSGIGLPMLHRAVCRVDGLPYRELPVAEIARHARDGTDAGCAATIASFGAMLGTLAGNLALTLGATGGSTSAEASCRNSERRSSARRFGSASNRRGALPATTRRFRPGSSGRRRRRSWARRRLCGTWAQRPAGLPRSRANAGLLLVQKVSGAAPTGYSAAPSAVAGLPPSNLTSLNAHEQCRRSVEAHHLFAEVLCKSRCQPRSCPPALSWRWFQGRLSHSRRSPTAC